MPLWRTVPGEIRHSVIERSLFSPSHIPKSISSARTFRQEPVQRHNWSYTVPAAFSTWVPEPFKIPLRCINHPASSICRLLETRNTIQQIIMESLTVMLKKQWRCNVVRLSGPGTPLCVQKMWIRFFSIGSLVFTVIKYHKGATHGCTLTFV